MANLDLQGVDISNHQPNVNFDMMKGAGIDFIMAKVSQATSFLDPQWHRNKSEARRVGIVAGGYHFFRWDVDPLAQAKFFVQMLGPVLPGDLPPCVDLEKEGDGAGPMSYSTAEALNRARIFMEYVDEHTGRTCMIYSYPDMWKSVLGNSTIFSDRPLWVASYKSGSPALFGGWTKHALWQTTSTGHVPGWDGIVDLDRFTGTPEEWEILTGRTQQQGGSTKALYFEQTRHTVKAGFLDFFMAHGQVQIFGYPLTEEIDGTNGDWSGTVQWFERACFEWHTEIGQGVVMLRNLGTELAPVV